MATKVKLYTISFVDRKTKHILDLSIQQFLYKIENLLKIDAEKVIREINGKIIRTHAFKKDYTNDNRLVIPFGKLKTKNLPKRSDPSTHELVDIPEDMYDVNIFAYHIYYKVLMITSNKDGASAGDIEQYLNSFLEADTDSQLTHAIENKRELSEQAENRLEICQKK